MVDERPPPDKHTGLVPIHSHSLRNCRGNGPLRLFLVVLYALPVQISTVSVRSDRAWGMCLLLVLELAGGNDTHRPAVIHQ